MTKTPAAQVLLYLILLIFSGQALAAPYFACQDMAPSQAPMSMEEHCAAMAMAAAGMQDSDASQHDQDFDHSLNGGIACQFMCQFFRQPNLVNVAVVTLHGAVWESAWPPYRIQSFLPSPPEDHFRPPNARLT